MKSTKKSLLLSTLSLILCFAMLLGTTYAWFTDEVTSGVNQIKAGNLDIEVSYKNGDNWESIEGKDSLFTNNLWEPGHTEYVTLKIENKGSLALTYKMMVTPVNEAGGINMAGQPFKLSDYLVFGTTTASANEPNYTRETARAAAGNTMQLNQAGLVKTSTILATDGTEYVTLVVYMPEEVGNVANYKTGTTAPTIDLGIKVVATQVENENDSFGDDYDGGADTVAPFSVGPIYDYFPQVVKTVDVTKDDQNKVSTLATIEVNESDDENAQLLASVEIPVGVQLNEGADKLTLKVTPQEITANYSATALDAEIQNENREIANFDVKVEGVAPENTTNLTVNVFIGKGLSNVKIYHNGVEISGASYNSTTGIATFQTPTFSDYTMAYDKAVAAIGTQTYGTLELAIAAAQGGETITMLKNVEEANGISVPSGKSFTVDFNGFTYSTEKPGAGSQGTKTQAFQLLKDSTITFKNGTINCTTENKDATWDSSSTEKGVAMIIQNYCDLTLDDMVIDGTNIAHNGAATRYVMSNNCGNITIKNSTIIAMDGDFAFDSCKYGSYEIPDVTLTDSTVNGKIELSGGKLNITSGTVNGEIVTADGYTTGDCTITGGTFSSNPISYVATGYGAVESNGKWTVTGTWSSHATNVSEDNITITTAAELAGFAANVNAGKTYAGKTVTLGANIDLGAYVWDCPIGRGGKRFQGTFDGQNYTIKNLTSVLDSTSGTQYGNGLFGDITGGATLKNFVVENANVYDKVDGKGNVYGIVCGYAYGTVTFENITVKNSKISAFGKVAAILGMAADGNGTTTIKNCKVEDTEITGAYNCATFAGLTQNTVSMSGNTQTNVTYKYSSRYGAEAYTDLNTTAASGDAVNGKYWKYTDKIYYAAWADQYNEQKETTISDESITLDAIVHNY